MQEHADMITGIVADLPDPYIRMIDSNVTALGEGDAEQPTGGVECCLHHIVEDEVWLHLSLVEIVLGLPDFLGIVAPVPGFDRLVQPFFVFTTCSSVNAS